MEHIKQRPRTYLEVHGDGLHKQVYFLTPNEDQPALPSALTHSGMPPTPGRGAKW